MTTPVAKFTPLWTGSSTLGAFIEGAAVSVQVAAHNSSRTVVATYATALDCGAFCSDIVSVAIDGVAAPYSVAGTTIVFAPVMTSSAVVEIIASTSNTFSLLCENLPPGLTMSPSGLISGTLGAIIPLGTNTYEFVIRATNAQGRVADMTFTMSGTSASYPVSFDLDLLPDAVVDPFLNISYIPLGSYQPSQAIAYSIDVVAHDDAPTVLVLDNSFYVLVNDNKEFTGPPPGVVLTGTEIIGQIAADALDGLYLFKTGIAGTTLNLIFGVEVIPYAGIPYRPPVSVQWLTAANLGTLREGEPCYLSVVAEAYAYDAPVLYSLVEISSNLPPGLTISSSGELTGALEYGLSNATFTFTIRATAGTTFIDRAFTLTAVSKFIAPTIYDIGFELEVYQAEAFMAPYASLIPATSLFRADDANFGMANPRIYLLNGIDGSLDLTTVLAAETLPAVTNSSYFSPIRFLLGEHACATATDSSGVAAYDVVYRKFYEFDPDAGGFTTGNTPVASPVLYPQSRVSGGVYVYPVCVRNMRCKLLTAFGCATSATIAKTFGPSGGENPPRWMGAQYILAAPIAYVLPGAGAAIAATLNASSTVAPNGFEYTFDRLSCLGGNISSLQF